jgi:hypothetical protein
MVLEYSWPRIQGNVKELGQSRIAEREGGQESFFYLADFIMLVQWFLSTISANMVSKSSLG